MKNWQYMVVVLRSLGWGKDMFVAQINGVPTSGNPKWLSFLAQNGKDGWELVTIQDHMGGDGKEAIFKRLLEE